LRKDGTRSAQFGELVGFATESRPHSAERNVEAGRKSIDLKVAKDGGYLKFDFWKASPVRLEILDLATFNPNGEVKIEQGQVGSEALLPGQRKGLTKVTKMLNAAIPKEKRKQKDIEKSRAKCQLTMRTDSPFNTICMPDFPEDGGPKMLEWNIMRTGRLRSPYVDVLIDQQLAILNRRAMDIDYLPDVKSKETDQCTSGECN
jgi:hypothetical protein